MAAAVYILATLTCLACSILLLRGHASSGRKLLFWSGLCFAGLAVSNSLVFLDLVVWPSVDLYPWRLATSAAAMVLLLYGLIWESR